MQTIFPCWSDGTSPLQRSGLQFAITFDLLLNCMTTLHQKLDRQWSNHPLNQTIRDLTWDLYCYGSTYHKGPTELHWVQFWFCRSDFDSFIFCPAWTHNKCGSIEVRFCSGVVLPQDTKCPIDGKTSVRLWVCGRITSGPEVKCQSSKRTEVRLLIDKQVTVCYLCGLWPLSLRKNCKETKMDRVEPEQ